MAPPLVEPEFAIRDGSAVVVRPIEPGDKDTLADGFAQLSARSRYTRFLAPTDRLTTAMLRYFTEVDHHDHEALLAIDPETRDGIGVARYVRTPDDPTRAEAAITVTDDWQGRGVGSLLLDLLAGRAREEGLTHFRAMVLAENRAIIDLLESRGPLEVVGRSQGSLEVEAQLPGYGVGPGLQGLLRAAALATAE